MEEQLFKLADEKYKKFHKNLCPGLDNMIGIRVPILRDYAKKIYQKNDWKREIKKIKDNYYEEIMLQGMLIGLAKNESIDVILQYIENYVPKITNWALCDVFCAGLKITKNNKEKMWNFIQKYLKSDKEFEIRFGVVMILDFYIEKEYLKEVFEIFDRIKNEDYYVKMAIAWAISVCLVKYYDETYKYLENAKIDKWTYNKSLQKAIESYRITDKQKDNLRKIKKS